MKVLIIRHGIFPGFVAPIAKEWAKCLWQSGVEVAVAAIGKYLPQSDTEQLGFPVYGIEVPSIVKVYSTLRELIETADIVHYFPGTGLEILPLLSRRAKFIFNYTSVSVTGDIARDRLVNFGKRLQPVFADHVIYTDQALASALRPIIPKPVSLLPVGYPDDLFFPISPHTEQSERLLIYHGAVRPQRRLDQTIRVLAALPQQYRLMIIGGGLAADEAHKQELAQLAQQLNCADRLILTNMPQAKIRDEIAKAYLCLSYVPMLECFQDQFVLKTLEYLACQRPVLTTNTRYNKQFSDSIGRGRLLLADDTVEDMVEKIIGSDEYVRAFYSAENLAALPTLLAPFTSSYIMKTRLIPIYRSVLGFTKDG